MPAGFANIFVVSSQVFAQMPTAGVVAAYGIDNSKPVPAIAKLLQTAIMICGRHAGTSPKDHLILLPIGRHFNNWALTPINILFCGSDDETDHQRQ